MRTKASLGLYIPAPKLNQLHILNQVASDPRITQAELAERCSLSVAMVNNYMKELCDRGLLEYRRKNSKTISYHVTDAGKEAADVAQNELLQELTRLFGDAKDQVRDMIQRRVQGDLKRVVLYGSGILAEIAFHALETAKISVIAVCSDDPTDTGQEWCGRARINVGQIRFIAPDAVIVASSNGSGVLDPELIPLGQRGIDLVRLDCWDPEPEVVPKELALTHYAP